MDTDVKKMVINWLNNQPKWIKKIFSNILNKNEIISADEAKLIVNEMINLDTFEDPIFNFTDSLNAIHKSSLLSIAHVHNISAIDSNKGIEFSEIEPTIVYGPNGSGKSSYIRILKKMSLDDPNQVLLKNIYANNDVVQEAQLTYEVDGTRFTKSLKNYQGDKFLNTLQIFDTAISDRYILQGNESSYEPLILSSLKQLIQSIKTVNEQLNEQKKLLITTSLPFISDDRLKIDEDIRKGSKIFPISNIQLFSQEDENRLQNLNSLFQTRNIKKRIKVLKKSDGMISDILKTISITRQKFNINVIKEYRGLVKSLQDNKVIKKNLENDFLENSSLESNIVLSDSNWNKMWHYACEYMNDNSEGEHCALCGQTLQGKFKEKYIEITNYFNNQVNLQIEIIEKRLANIQQSMSDFDNLETLIDNCFLILDVSDEDKRAVEEHGKNICSQITNLNTMNETIYDSLLFLETFYNSKQDAIREELKLLLENDNEEKILTFKTELINLRKKKYFFQNKEQIRQNNLMLEKIELIKSLLKETNTMSITKLIDKISNKLITQTYIDRFNSELSNLMMGRENITKVDMVKQPARKGKILLSLEVRNHSDIQVCNVLSEGEKRIVSLAAFLADSNSSGTNTPLIIDDPITSLDMEFETAVIKRLVELSKDRQVIIFTHRLSLVKQIQNLKKESKFIELYSIDQKKGIPMDMSLEKIGPKEFTDLQKKLNNIKKLTDTPDEYRTALWKLCQDFRKMVEKSIEDILIGRIVSRFSPEIKSMQVKRLANITSGDCQIVDDMMTKYSGYEHSQSEEKPMPEPNINDLERDITNFLKWSKEAKKRLNNSTN